MGSMRSLGEASNFQAPHVSLSFAALRLFAFPQRRSCNGGSVEDPYSCTTASCSAMSRAWKAGRWQLAASIGAGRLGSNEQV